MENSLKNSIAAIEQRATGVSSPTPECSIDFEPSPWRVSTQIEPGADFGVLKLEVLIGRSLWLNSLRRLLSTTAKVLHEHRWTILRAPTGTSWFTSDDPVIKLNYYQNGNYDFKGGWGRHGGQIFLPLDSNHLLFTHIGFKPPQRGTVADPEFARKVRKLLAEHAHRAIFSAYEDPEIPLLRPRIVDENELRNERDQWAQWHESQRLAESSLEPG
jgi:hypothetical protein